MKKIDPGDGLLIRKGHEGSFGEADWFQGYSLIVLGSPKAIAPREPPHGPQTFPV